LPAFSGGWDTQIDSTFYSADLNNFTQKDANRYGGVAYTGYVYSARDQIGFQRFRHWIITNVKHAIDAQPDTVEGRAQKTNIQNLLNEFTFGATAEDRRDDHGTLTQSYIYNQPYGGDEWTTNSTETMNVSTQFIGWDRFHSNWTTEVTPDGITPYYNNTGVNGHRNFVISQVMDMNRAQMTGKQNVVYTNTSGTHSVNMYNTNWAVHTVGIFLGAQEDLTKKCLEAIELTHMDQIRYKKDLKKYNDAKKAKKYQEMEQKRDIAIADQKSLQRKRMNQAKRPARPVVNQNAKPKPQPVSNANDAKGAIKEISKYIVNRSRQASQARQGKAKSSNNNKQQG
jgi:hypothetical protein